ncbi:MAG: hypothetical protein EOP50_15660, partial [Sphingobacteriales bacterium]
MQRAILRTANLSGALLRDANLQGADVSNAHRLLCRSLQQTGSGAVTIVTLPVIRQADRP